MRKRTRINQQRADYPIIDKFHSYDGMDYQFTDDEPDYNEELDVPEWEEI